MRGVVGEIRESAEVAEAAAGRMLALQDLQRFSDLQLTVSRCLVKAVQLQRLRVDVLVVHPASSLSHAASTLPVYVQANGLAVRL